MTRTRRWTAAAALACTALLLAACSDDSSAKEGSGPVSAEDYENSPLGVYYTKLSGGEQPTEEDYAQMNVQSEEIVAACMLEQGFEYEPVDNSSMTSTSTVDEEFDPSSREYVEKYGYGMTTMYEENAAPVEDTEEWVDPNAEYVEAMSETERTAYYEALYGVQEEYVEGEEAPAYDWTTAGCQGKAQHEVYDELNGAWNMEEFAALQEEISGIYEQLQSDPAMTELNQKWASCMADAGYDYDTQQAAMDDIMEQSNALYGDGTSESGPDKAKLKEVAATEIAVATADFDCRKDLDFERKTFAIQSKLEQAFVDQHKAELDAWVEAATQK
ncbi:hypothetical protein [Cellulomonas soli]